MKWSSSHKPSSPPCKRRGGREGAHTVTLSAINNCHRPFKNRMNILSVALIFCSACSGLCLWETAAPAVSYSNWTRPVAEAGCPAEACVPLGSWPDDPFRDYGVYGCAILTVACDVAVAASLSESYGRLLFRSFKRAGLDSATGWWSGSTRTGEYIEGAYVNSTDRWLFGAGNIEHDHDGVLKKWLCICV